MSDILAGLNENQLRAATTTEGYLRVIAGAGSGKTKLLVSRYAYLVAEYGIAPANILCVTFTNKAAGEMKRRIRSMIGGEYDTSLISTYHGFCVRVLREDIEKVFYPKEFTIIDKSQQKSILGEIYRKMELKLDYASFEKMLDLIAGYKAKNRSYVRRMCARDGGPIMEDVTTQDERIIEEYMQCERQRYAMDFSDLIYFTLDIFYRCPDVLAKWQDRLNYIQVDEFQDSSGTEMELIDLLSAKYRNLMIVGDPDQNIYEWRGSDVRLLVDFDKTHTGCETIFLNQNYRSTPEILRCANALIEKNVLRLKKDLFTRTGSGDAVLHYHAKSEFEEAERIVENIAAIRETTGCGYGSFAVLYRSGFLSRVVEKKFTESAIPYEIFGGVKFYRRMEILDIMAYLRLVALDENDSFRRIINTPRRRFGRTRLEHLVSLAGGGSLFDTLAENLDDPVFAGSGAAEFVSFIRSVRESYPTARLSETVERVCAGSGYEQYIRELGDMERFDNLSEFKRISGEYEKSFGEDVTLPEFIRQVELQSADSDDEDGGDTVKLMTIHSAKGLEFPYVFVLGFSEGIFPSAKTIEARRELGLEEERRLCYVAVTRAERRLFLLDSEGTTSGGRTKVPSRFLFEMGEENYTRIGTIPKELREQSDKLVSGDAPKAVTLPSVGDTVSHPAFGDGVVLAYDEKKLSYRVQFDKIGQTRDIAVGFFTRQRRTAAEPVPAAEDTAVTPDIEGIKNVSETADAAAEVTTDIRAAAAEAMRQAMSNAEEAARRAIEVAEAHRAERLAESARRAKEMRRTEELLRAAAAERSPSATASSPSATASSPSVTAATLAGARSEERSPSVPASSPSVTASPSATAATLADARSEERSPSATASSTSVTAATLADARSEERSPSVTAATLAGARSEEPEQQGISFDLPADDPVQWERLFDADDADGDIGDEIGDGDSEDAEADDSDFYSLSSMFDSSPEELRPVTRDCSNLWEDPRVPKTGWACTGVTDLGAPTGVCEMCGHQIIRYVHHMIHPRYRPLGVGCVCAGKMEGDIERARRREASFKNYESRKKNFAARKWKVSKNKNEYLKIKGHIIVLYEDKARGIWRYSFDSTFCRESYPDRESAVLAVFEEVEKI